MSNEKNTPFNNPNVQKRMTYTDKNHEGWRQFIFGDAHGDSHDFAETAMRRAPKEIFCAAAASLLVSPIVSIIDKSIVVAGPGKGEFAKAMMDQTKEMFVKPKAFLHDTPIECPTATAPSGFIL